MEFKEGYIYQYKFKDKSGEFEFIGDYGNGVLEIRFSDRDETTSIPRTLLEEMVIHGSERIKEEKKPEQEQKAIEPSETKKKIDVPLSVKAFGWLIPILLFGFLGMILYNVGSCIFDKFKKEEVKQATVSARQPERPEPSKERIDSISRELEEGMNWVDSKTPVLIKKGDSVYHTTIHCDSIKLSYNDYKKRDVALWMYSLKAKGEIKIKQYKQCEDCYRIESILKGYEDGEIIDAENADEYCSHSE